MQGKELPGRSAGKEVYVGIDVCKDRLDVYLHPVGHKFQVANTDVGLKKLRRQFAGHDVALVVIEATAKYHRLTQRMLHAAGFRVAVINPLRSHLFAQASWSGAIRSWCPFRALVRSPLPFCSSA